MSEFRLYIPIAKVDKEGRTVAGWATTETIDKQGEVVDYGASKAAFGEWHGNIREMHEPKAVGKAIEVLPHDDERRVWVKAYISKGAEDTWQKVVDGTLTGFSIGGQTIDKCVQIIKDTSTNTARQITRITKYRLNELSLVDNPANPEAQFALVKADGTGTLYQTELVEDARKVIITQAEDFVGQEIKAYRDKADGLAKKVLTEEELEQLPDDEFGIIRRYTSSQGTVVKERLFAMPDKVHAYAALKKLDSYPLSDPERKHVHEKAAAVLGASHEASDCSLCQSRLRKGGESTEMETKVLEDLVAKVATLIEKVDALVKGAYEGAHKPVAGAKETPKEEGDNPTDATAVKPSSPEKPGHPENSNLKTQETPAAPVKKEAEGDGTEKAANPATSNLKTQEEPAAPVKKETEKAANLAISNLKTQESPAAPVKKDHAEDEEEDEDKDKPKDEAGDVHKADTAATTDRTELKKLQATVDSLRKQVEDLSTQPLPRKYKVEKTYGPGDDTPVSTDDQELQKAYDEVLAAVRSGRPLTPDLKRKQEWVLSKRLESKFAHDLRKF